MEHGFGMPRRLAGACEPMKCCLPAYLQGATLTAKVAQLMVVTDSVPLYGSIWA